VNTRMLSLIAVLSVSCNSLGSPTAPDGQVQLSTAYGLVSVWSDGSTYNLDTIKNSLERGQRRALAQRIDVPNLNGLTVAIYRKQVWAGVDSVGAYNESEDVVMVLAGVEEVVDHELQHRAAWKLGHHGPCFTLQDHSPGYRLDCSERP